MSDLAEVRRFWPWMRPPHVDTSGYKTYACQRRGTCYLAHIHQQQWWISVVPHYMRRWVNVFGDADGYRIGGGDTIAEAMAAAGFGVREPDKYARQRQQKSRWVAECQRGEGDFFSMTQPEYRQRPRKGVRLGKGRRAQAAKGGRG